MREIAPGFMEGGTAGEPAPMVQTVSMYQARTALARAGKLAAAEAAIDALQEPQRQEAKIAWEFRPTVRRDSALVQQIGAAIGLTDADMDDLFAAAVAIS